MVSSFIHSKKINRGVLSTISTISIHWTVTLMLEELISNGLTEFLAWLWANNRTKGNYHLRRCRFSYHRYSFQNRLILYQSLFFPPDLVPFTSTHWPRQKNLPYQTLYYKMKHAQPAAILIMTIHWLAIVDQTDKQRPKPCMRKQMFYFIHKWTKTVSVAGEQTNHLIQIHKVLSIPIPMHWSSRTIWKSIEMTIYGYYPIVCPCTCTKN